MDAIRDLANQQAIEITKTICANPSSKIQLNEQSALEIAEFIATLTAKMKKEY